MTRRVLTRSVVPVALGMMVTSLAHAQAHYAIRDLGTLGGNVSTAYAVNAAGHIVGTSTTAMATSRAFLWTRQGGMVDLGTLGGASSDAYDINEAGHIVGSAETQNGERHAFLWTSSVGMIDLGTLGGDFSSAYGINNQGEVVGQSINRDGVQAFHWTAARGMTAFEPFGPYRAYAAYDINDRGQVAGQAVNVLGSGDPAFLWTPGGGFEILDTLGAPNAGASGISAREQVAGTSYVPSGHPHAFSWTRAGGTVDLRTLGGSWSQADDVNEQGQVVGRSDTGAGVTRGFVWTTTAGMVDLGALAGPAAGSVANGINRRGWIVGGSHAGPAGFHAVLWKPCAPTIRDVRVRPAVLWPPNHRLTRVIVDYVVEDDCGLSPTTTLTVSSSEADGRGDGHTVDDTAVLDAHTVLLRAERSGAGNGRTYTIRIEATSGPGLTATADVSVVVPKSARDR